MKNEKELFDSSWENEKMTIKKNHKIILKKKITCLLKRCGCSLAMHKNHNTLPQAQFSPFSTTKLWQGDLLKILTGVQAQTRLK